MAAVLAIVVVLAACGDDSGSAGGGSDSDTTAQTVRDTGTGAVPDDPEATEFAAAEPGSGEGLTLGYVSVGEAIPFAKILSDSIKEEARLAGARLVFCDAKLDAAAARACVENLKTLEVDAYGTSQYDARAAPSLCAAGPQVPVMSITVQQDPCGRVFFGANDKRAGQIAGVGMGEMLKERFDCEYDAVVSLQNPAVGDVNTQRRDGWLEGLEQVCGPLRDSRVVDTRSTTDSGRQVFTDVLTALPGAERIVVFSLNDDLALGALAAAKAQGREEQVFISGQGADPSAQCEIAENPQWVGDAGYFPEQWGKPIVRDLIAMAKGETVPGRVFVPHTFVDAETIGEYYEPSC